MINGNACFTYLIKNRDTSPLKIPFRCELSQSGIRNATSPAARAINTAC